MSTPPKTLTKERLQELIHVNLGARRYFYTKADEGWLDWLWQHGFLDVIKEKTEGDYEYTPPELTYLVRMAEKCPAKVVDIMLDVPLSTDPFDMLNRDVMYSFLRICSTLPADQLARVVDKICHERWVPLIGVESNQSYHLDYEKMFQTLAAAEEYKSVIVLAEAVLAVRTREEMKQMIRYHYSDNPFYFDKLSHTKVFDCLVRVDTAYEEQALALTTKTMATVITLWGPEGEGETMFAVFDEFPLLEVDFFALELGQGIVSLNGNVRELAAAVKVLAARLIGQSSAKTEEVRRIYEEQIASLPDSWVMWRLRLFIWSLCPHVFQAELTEAFLRLFAVEHAFEIVQAEYLHALRAGFSVLADADKEAFVKRTIETFSQQSIGSHILSMILPYLNEQPALKKQAEEAGIQLDPTYEPQPVIGEVKGGLIKPRGPLTQEKFGQIPIDAIARNLRDEWSPEQLSIQNTDDDFLHPLNARGIGDLLKKDMRERLQEYVTHAAHFFNRERLDPHYTYAYLWGILETILQHRTLALTVNWDGIVALCSTIKKSENIHPFENITRGYNRFDGWLTSWDVVHSTMSDLLQELLTEKDGQVLVDFGKHRNQIFSIIQYLLSHPEPSPTDEHIETTKHKRKSHGDADYRVINPFDMAISTVRGKAFEAFVWFVEQDGKGFNPEDQVTISDDVKALYGNILRRENTRALMFLFGRYLPSFYARDREWIRQLLPRIFPNKSYLYTAAWEGYLSNNTLYTDVFYDPAIQPLYQRGLALTDADYPPQQEHFREPDEGIAEHLALAFMYDQDGLDHPLFIAFWENDNSKRHVHFVDFLGNQFIFRSRASEHLARRPERTKWLRDFWDWLLEKHENPETFRQFSHWIDLEKEIFEPAWLAERIRKTLEKTNGIFDNDWGHKLNNTETNVQLAQAAPKDTLEIARLHLFEGEVWVNQPYSLHGDEWYDAFKVLYNNLETRAETAVLINALVQEGGRPFWHLAKIIG